MMWYSRKIIMIIITRTTENKPKVESQFNDFFLWISVGGQAVNSVNSGQCRPTQSSTPWVWDIPIASPNASRQHKKCEPEKAVHAHECIFWELPCWSPRCYSANASKITRWQILLPPLHTMQTVCRCREMMYGCWKSRHQTEDSSYVTEKGVSKCVQWVGTLILKGVYICVFFVGLNPLKVKIDLTFTGMDSFSFILQSLASFLSNFPSIIYINVKECRSIPAWERRRQALCLMVFVSGERAKHEVDSGGKTSLDNSCICDALALR